jgi:hypothetical protein
MSDIIINGETYEGVESITVNKTDGEQETFVLPDKVGTTVTAKDAEGNDVALLTWDADTKVDKIESVNKLYATDVNGEPYAMSWSLSATSNSVPRRDGAGCLYSKKPTENGHVATKLYVDETVANAGGGGGKLYRHTLTFYANQEIKNYDVPSRIFVLSNISTPYPTLSSAMNSATILTNDSVLYVWNSTYMQPYVYTVLAYDFNQSSFACFDGLGMGDVFVSVMVMDEEYEGDCACVDFVDTVTEYIGG